MTDPTNGSSNPAAEAEVLKAKTPPPPKPRMQHRFAS
jgi:hypothetical protein